jgi:hypothetical protein
MGTRWMDRTRQEKGGEGNSDEPEIRTRALHRGAYFGGAGSGAAASTSFP